jgi:hypothetical protein
MFLDQSKYAVGKFSCRQDVENVLKELKQAGFLTTQISVLTHETTGSFPSNQISVTVEDSLLEDETIAGIMGALVGGVAGFYLGLSLLGMPGFGVFVTLGTFGAVLMTSFVGGVLGKAIGGVVGRATALEPPQHWAATRQVPGEYLVMISGVGEEVAIAEGILDRGCSSKVWIC